MTVSTIAARDPDVRRPLQPAFDAATAAVRDAHEAARALTDTLLACRHLPGEIYGYAPDVPQTAAALAAASRATVDAARYASTDPSPERMWALHLATEEVARAAAGARNVAARLRAAAGWFASPSALAGGSGQAGLSGG